MIIVDLIQSVLLIIATILIFISAIGLITLDKDTNNKVYARLHIVGLFDIACVIALIGIGQYLLAGIYFILAPFTAHAIANAYWKKEDRENNMDLVNVVEKVDEDNPFIHPKKKVQALENKDPHESTVNERFSITKLEIDEGE